MNVDCGCASISDLFPHALVRYDVMQLWYYSPRFGWGYWLAEKGFHRVDVSGQQAREIFVRSTCCVDGGDGNVEANIAIQAARNPITAQSILATGAVAVATTLVNIILDHKKMMALKDLNHGDILTGKSDLISPEIKIVAAILSLFLSFFSLVQSLRLFVHAGYFIRASSFLSIHPEVYSEMYGTNDGDNHMYKLAIRTNRRAQTFFSLGLRFLYMFIPVRSRPQMNTFFFCNA